ncbi:MAG: galactokinase family protein [Desulfobacteraceae bacterium]|jgi:galactokinase/galacturonokinase
MNTLIEEFDKHFPKLTPEIVFCPYRICPVGAHSDHQYGKILGMAIDKGITIAYSPSEDSKVELISRNFKEKVKFHVSQPLEIKKDWADYLRGAASSISRNYTLKKGIYAIIEGSLPIGGLSSSAALIISFLKALCNVNNLMLSDRELIETALWAEKDFVGVNVGKLDQSCEVFCKKDHLLYLDTLDDSYELIPVNPVMKPYEIAVFFSGVERTLVGSKFNMRVDELKSASYALKAFAGLDYSSYEDSRLRDVPEEIFSKYGEKLPGNWKKRAKHYYTEFARVEAGAEAWRNGDIETLGKLSFESCWSSINNFETGSDELKTLYEITLRTDGIYGGRFSGAGFKGCFMVLIDPEYRSGVEEKVRTEYLKVFPELEGKYSTHFCKSADGVGMIKP